MADESFLNKYGCFICKPERHYFLNIILITCLVFLLLINFELYATPDYRPMPRPNNGKREMCSDIFEIKDPTSSNSDGILISAMEDISLSKRTLKYLRYVAYFALSTFIPALVTEELSSNGTNYSVTKEYRLDRMKGSLPYLPCQLRRYNPDDVFQCIETRSRESKTFRITFMGDSRIRRLMEYTLEFLHKFNFNITMEDGTSTNIDELLDDKHKMNWPKYKQELNVESSNIPNFKIRFYWAPNLGRGDAGTDTPKYMNYLDERVFSKMIVNLTNKQLLDVNIRRRKVKGHSNDKLKGQIERGRNKGITDELKRLERKPKGELPDFIIIDSGLWLLYHYDEGILYNIEKRAVSGIRNVHRALNELAKKVTVVVLLPHPIKEYLTYFWEPGSYYLSIQNMVNLEWHLNAQSQLFPRNVLIWDSFLPVAYASVSDCKNIMHKRINISSLPKILRFDEANGYGCQDKIHLGYEAHGIAFQMMINHICNADMEKVEGNSYCCEG